MTTTLEAINEAESLRDVGMELAARRKEWLIRRDKLRFLDALMARPDRTASMDDTEDDLAAEFGDGGKWRGSVVRGLASQGLIEMAGVIRSSRIHRHRGYLSLWRARDVAGIELRRAELRQWLAANPEPAEPSLFENETLGTAMPSAN